MAATSVSQRTLATPDELYEYVMKSDEWAVAATETINFQSKVMHKIGDAYKALKHQTQVQATKPIVIKGRDHNMKSLQATARDGYELLKSCGLALENN